MSKLRNWFAIFVLSILSLQFVVSPVTSQEKPPAQPQANSQTSLAPVIFHNGTILTVDANNSQAEAILIQDNTIVAVGSNTEILAMQDADTILVDLQGRTMVPGLIDGHTHILRNRPAEVSLEEAQAIALSFGLTGLSELSADQGYVDELLTAEANNELRLRVNVFPEYNTAYLDNGQRVDIFTWYRDNPPILDEGRRLRIPGVKVFVDGAFDASRGCLALSEPYPESFVNTPDFQGACHSDKGDLYFTQQELNAAVLDIQNHGYRVAMHAMGDAAVEMGLNAIENALDGVPNRYRHQIHHNSVIRPDQIQRFADLDILASVRGYFNTCDIAYYSEWYGADRGDWAVNRYGLVVPEIHAFYEADFLWFGDPYAVTGASPSPFVGLYGYVTHQQLQADGTACPPTDWLAHYQISAETALRMMTIEAAYAVSQEEFIGSLEPNKFADLTILSDNPLTIDPNNLYQIEALMTMVDGQVEFCRDGFAQLCPERDLNTAPPVAGNVLFSEDFSSNAVAWEEANIDIASSNIVNGQYVIIFTADQYNGWGVGPGTDNWSVAPIFTTPYELSLDVSGVSSTNNDYCISVDFDTQQNGDFKRFRFCGDHSWEFSTYTNGTLTVVNQGVNGQFDFLDSLTHTVTVRITSTNYALLVDNQPIADVANQGAINGTIRFGIMRSKPDYTVLQAVFDNLLVTEIK